MKTIGRRHVLIAVAVAYALGLVWGYLRLPWAAVKALRDFEMIAAAPSVEFMDAGVAPAQLWYLKQSLRESPAPIQPRVIVDVSVPWYEGMLARVRSGYMSSRPSELGASEGRDGLYLCLFGAWVPVRTYSSEIS